MALARTNLLGAVSGASGNFGTGAWTTGSFTPPSGSMLIIALQTIENGGSSASFADLTITDSLGVPLTYTVIPNDVSADTTFVTSLRTWRAFVGTGVSMTLTFDAGARSMGMYGVSVVAYTGYDAASPIGALGTVSVVGGAGPPTPATLTLSGAPALTSDVFGAIAANKDTAGVTPGATFAELHEVLNTTWGGLETEARTGSVSTTVDWVDLRSGGGAMFNYAGQGIEIRAASDTPPAAPATPLPPPLLQQLLMAAAAQYVTSSAAPDVRAQTGVCSAGLSGSGTAFHKAGGAGTTPPTYVTEYESAWNGTTAPLTASVTVSAGDVLVLYTISALPGSAGSAPTGGTGLTWTLRQSIAIAGVPACYLWTTTSPTGQSFTLSVPYTPGGEDWGFNCLQFSNSAGVGVSNKATDAVGGLPAVVLTPGAARSTIVSGHGDWNEQAIAGRVWRTINGVTPTSGNGMESMAVQVVGHYSVFGARWDDVGTPAAYTAGMTVPINQAYGIVAIEVLGSTGAASVPTAAVAGLTGRGTAVKVAPQTGVTSMGLVGRGAVSVSDIRAQTGRTTLGLVAYGSSVKRAPQTGAAALGAAGYGAEGKRATPTGVTALGLVGYGPSQSGARSQTGRTSLGLTGYGAPRHLAAAAGLTALGITARGTAVRRAPATGLASLGLAGRGTAGHRGSATGRTVLALVGYGTASQPFTVPTLGLDGAAAAAGNVGGAADAPGTIGGNVTGGGSLDGPTRQPSQDGRTIAGGIE